MGSETANRKIKQAIKHGLRVLDATEILGEYRDSFISTLQITYSNFSQPDINRFKSLDELEFPLQAERIWMDKKTEHYEILCAFLGTEPYSKMFGRLAVYVVISGNIYRYTYHVHRVLPSGSRAFNAKMDYESKEKLSTLTRNGFMLIENDSYSLSETSMFDKEINTYVKQYIASAGICRELSSRQRLSKYRLYLEYRQTLGDNQYKLSQ